MDNSVQELAYLISLGARHARVQQTDIAAARFALLCPSSLDELIEALAPVIQDTLREPAMPADYIDVVESADEIEQYRQARQFEDLFALPPETASKTASKPLEADTPTVIPSASKTASETILEPATPTSSEPEPNNTVMPPKPLFNQHAFGETEGEEARLVVEKPSEPESVNSKSQSETKQGQHAFKETGNEQQFVHLHLHTEHSPLDGLTRVIDAVRKAKEDHAGAVAVTDHGSINGWYVLHKTAAKEGITPIYGEEMYLAMENLGESRKQEKIVMDRFSRDAEMAVDAGDVVEAGQVQDEDDKTAKGGKRKTYHHLTVLAKNRKGFNNLIAMHNEAEASYWYKPRIDYDLLKKYGEGLLVFTGCIGGPIAGPLARNQEERAQRHMDAIIDAVGKENVYVELMDHGIDLEVDALPRLVEFAEKNQVQTIATNDCHYTEEREAHAHDAWLAVGTKDVVDSPTRAFQFNGGGYHYRSGKEMFELRSEDWWKQACRNTVKVAKLIESDHLIDLGQRLPKFVLPKGVKSSRELFHTNVIKGAKERFGTDDNGELSAEVLERLAWEEEVIVGAGVEDYFLILQDIIEWARSDRGIPTKKHPRGKKGTKKPIGVGDGRGSVGGSAAAYCLGITGIDPIEHKLLFERFLNPERAGMPDIDTDFEKARRSEVVAYMLARYGAEQVARIGTFGMNRSRAALKDAGRALGNTTAGINLAEAVPLDGATPVPLTKVIDESFEPGKYFRKALKEQGDIGQQILDVALSFETVVRNVSIHACATLVADLPLAEIVPLRYERGKNGAIVEGASRIVGWEGYDIESYGLLKMDILGLITLDVVSQALEYAEEQEGHKIVIPEIGAETTIHEPKVQKAFELVSRGETAGVFQLASRGMRELATEVKPNSLDDLTALVALYRPGPMGEGMHTKYARRKNGLEQVSYSDFTTNPQEVAVLESVLGPTYAVICYQEQLMQIGTAVGGLDAGMTNKLRKAFSKKIPELMEEVHQEFVKGALAGNGPAGVKFARSTVDEIWKTFDASADYLFNRSHAAAYGLLAYKTAYLKANWPTAFSAAVLATVDGQNKEAKRRDIIRSLIDESIPVYPPDVNNSQVKTAPYKDGVIIGLSEVKGVKAAGEQIVAARGDEPYTSKQDVLERTREMFGKDFSVSSGDVVGLIEAGAFDAFGPRLGQVMTARAPITDHLYDVEWGAFEKDARQRGRLGFTVGPHPLVTAQQQVFDALDYLDRDSITHSSTLMNKRDGSIVTVVGILTSLSIRDGRKSRYGLVNIETANREEFPGIMWSSAVEAIEESDNPPRIGFPVLVKGRIRHRQFSVETTQEDGTEITQEITQTELVIDKITSIPLQDEPMPEGRMIEFPRKIIVVDDLEKLEKTDANHSGLKVQRKPEQGPAWFAPNHKSKDHPVFLRGGGITSPWRMLEVLGHQPIKTSWNKIPATGGGRFV